tara:strand:+ start:1632 stop:1943 length:312 start_codon:yes stop_codon:yes gene_type:complete
MQLILNLAQENVEDLEKAIKILQKVRDNKVSGKIFSEGLDEFQEKKKEDMPEWLLEEEIKRKQQAVVETVQCSNVDSTAAKKLEEQKELMQKVDLSALLRGKK